LDVIHFGFNFITRFDLWVNISQAGMD